MEVDESFTEYVGTRWSMLYRLATLLVGDTQADEVTEAALLRAYLSWRDVQEAVSPDPVVKKLLVSTAVATLAQDLTSDVRPTSSTSAIDREALWSRITALPPRQRALVVLLDYEDVSEREAARLLGCSTSTVRTEALAALASPELAEFTPRDVREELLRRAEEVVVPLPPVDTLLPAARAAHRRRRQRTLGWWGTVVAVAVPPSRRERRRRSPTASAACSTSTATRSGCPALRPRSPRPGGTSSSRTAPASSSRSAGPPSVSRR